MIVYCQDCHIKMWIADDVHEQEYEEIARYGLCCNECLGREEVP